MKEGLLPKTPYHGPPPFRPEEGKGLKGLREIIGFSLREAGGGGLKGAEGTGRICKDRNVLQRDPASIPQYYILYVYTSTYVNN